MGQKDTRLNRTRPGKGTVHGRTARTVDHAGAVKQHGRIGKADVFIGGQGGITSTSISTSGKWRVITTSTVMAMAGSEIIARESQQDLRFQSQIRVCLNNSFAALANAVSRSAVAATRQGRTPQ